MTSSTGTRHEWTAPDGEVFPFSIWNAAGLAGSPRAVIACVHGLSGAASDFEPLGCRMETHGVTTLALELRGQGNDPQVRRRGDLEQIQDWFADLRAFFAMVRDRFPGAPIYYYGESMGAAILTRFVAQARGADVPVGLLLASPVVVVPGNPSVWQRLVFRFFLWVRPSHRLEVSRFAKPGDRDDPTKWVTRDEAYRLRFETASHKLDSYTFRFFKCLFDLIGGCLEAAPCIRVPVLVVYAAHDIFIPTEKVEDFFSRLGSLDKEIRLFPESYHLLLHDHDRDEVLACIEAWLLSRMVRGHPVLAE